ncbi:MAG: hypothetical protein ABEI77_10650 [Halorientalis sp.]
MSARRGVDLQSWLTQQFVIVAIVWVPSLVLVKLLWWTTLWSLYGPLRVFGWVTLSAVLAVALVVSIRVDPL